jgi:hypothetical protein
MCTFCAHMYTSNGQHNRGRGAHLLLHRVVGLMSMREVQQGVAPHCPLGLLVQGQQAGLPGVAVLDEAVHQLLLRLGELQVLQLHILQDNAT